MNLIMKVAKYLEFCRGFMFCVTGRVKELGFSEDKIYAVELGYISIINWLTQNEFTIEEFIFPSTLYVKC